LKITSLRNDFVNDQVPNVEIIPPPVLLPDGIEADSHLMYKEPVRIGFFGHYRKGEKDVEGIIRAFVQTNMGSKAEFVVQAAPTDPEDAEDMQRIMDMYSRETNVTFIKGKLFGKSWYDALQSVDILFLPYSNPRYLYNWSAVYFNALALYKPVLVTPVLNPEILAQYNIGAEVNLQDMDVLSVQLRDFLMSYKENIPMYENNLRKVNSDFSTAAFLKQILK
jgi:glycosyltransferase involved in cell wall biosynthesis